jgi:hypothetical protein
MNKKKRFDSYSRTNLDLDESSRLQKSIFVSIVSYGDDNVIRTINSLMLNAKRPENIFIGVTVVHNNEGWIETLLNLHKNMKNSLNVTYISNDSEDITYGKLKKYSDLYYNKEDYYLSISSASEFDPFWDDILIKQHQSFSYIVPNNLIFTAFPRGWLPHDEVIPGYVYFTNHMTNMSMQRELHDSAHIPFCGYHDFISEKEIVSVIADSETSHSLRSDIREIDECEKFLLQNGFPKFHKRKFVDDEFASRSFGLSSYFIFGLAKEYFKNNVTEDYLIDEEDFDFHTFINLLNNECQVFSLRYLPIYHLYSDKKFLSPKRKKISEIYSSEDMLEKQLKLRKNIIEKTNKIYLLMEPKQKDFFNYILAVDWEDKKFKVRKTKILNSIDSLINLCISMYNFSLNENSLHWNRIDK